MVRSVRLARIVLLPCCTLLAACSEESGRAPTVLESPAVPPSPTVGADAPPVELVALTEAQLGSTDLHGELACAFADAERGTLLVARADVRPDGPVHGVMSNSGYTELLANLEAGGFDDLADGITLAGKALTVRLVRGGPQPTGDESTRHAATLNVDPADGPSRTYEGTLTCGP